MKYITSMANKFREALDLARNSGEFDRYNSFYDFPRGCCGDASDLLTQFLLEHVIRTYYVCGSYYDDSSENSQSHAWLMTGNKIIIDITGNQFSYNPVFLNYDKPVYVGVEDEFHRLFEVGDRNIHENNGLDSLRSACHPRLNELYLKTIKYIL